VRLIPSAFAVRERLGDPRVVPNFRLLLCTNMSLSVTPEVQWLRMSSSFTIDTSLRVDLKRSASSSLPQSASRGARISGLPDSLPLRPARLFASLGGSDRVAPANRDFYFQAFDELVALFIAGYRYGSNWTISADGTFTHKSSSVIRCTRSVRAGLPHTALTVDVDMQTSRWDRGGGSSESVASVCRAWRTLPKSGGGLVGCVAVGCAAT
jgi:hypothetical protein